MDAELAIAADSVLGPANYRFLVAKLILFARSIQNGIVAMTFDFSVKSKRGLKPTVRSKHVGFNVYLLSF